MRINETEHHALAILTAAAWRDMVMSAAGLQGSPAHLDAIERFGRSMGIQGSGARSRDLVLAAGYHQWTCGGAEI